MVAPLLLADGSGYLRMADGGLLLLTYSDAPAQPGVAAVAAAEGRVGLAYLSYSDGEVPVRGRAEGVGVAGGSITRATGFTATAAGVGEARFALITVEVRGTASAEGRASGRISRVIYWRGVALGVARGTAHLRGPADLIAFAGAESVGSSEAHLSLVREAYGQGKRMQALPSDLLQADEFDPDGRVVDYFGRP